jgi:hypothetical protein
VDIWLNFVFDLSTSRYKQDTNVKGEVGEMVALAADCLYDRVNFDMSIATADFPSLDELAEDPGSRPICSGLLE